MHQKEKDIEEKVKTQSKIITEECERAVETIKEEGDKGRIDVANLAETLEKTIYTRIKDDKEEQYSDDKQSKYRSLILLFMSSTAASVRPSFMPSHFCVQSRTFSFTV
jgi:hypothetical protein